MDLFKSGTKRMLRDIESELRFTRGLIGEDALNARVMAAMARVPRERFVPGSMRHLAFPRPMPSIRASVKARSCSQSEAIRAVTTGVRPNSTGISSGGMKRVPQ